MKKRIKILIKVVLIICVAWLGLTFWVQFAGKQQTTVYKSTNSSFTALVTYNPDPIYNLDEQVCKSLAIGLQKSNITSTVSTVDLVDTTVSYDLVVFCANTYNWLPDWKITRLIKNYPNLQNKPVIAITLGSGSTASASSHLSKLLYNREANVLKQSELWLLKPNDETNDSTDNVQSAVDLAYEVGKSIKLEND